MEKVTLILFVVLSLCPLYPQEDKGIKVFVDKATENPILLPTITLNSREDFENVIPRETYILLIGNGNYTQESGYPDLSYAHSDVDLLCQIFIHCCKVNEDNISVYKDLAYKGFREAIAALMGTITPESRVIIFYSGHGREDGSLIFIDGEALTPVELKIYTNSFQNDTVLMLDACFAGEIEKARGIPFKQNCLRMYASLRHLPAKEIEYKTLFFKRFFSFYKETLNLPELKGNGYFTALLGIFFAQYKWSRGQNISFQDLLAYMDNQGKDYLEYLAEKGDLKEYRFRAEQLPKAFPPLLADLPFNNPDARYILLHTPSRVYRPKSNYLALGISGSLGFAVDKMDEVEYTISALLSLCYRIRLNNTGFLGLGFTSGLLHIPSKDGLEFIYALTVIPLAAEIQYQTNWDSPLYMLLSFSPGWGYLDLRREDNSHAEYTQSLFNIYLKTSVEFGMNLIPQSGFSIGLDYIFINCDFKSIRTQYHLINPEIKYIHAF